MRSNEKTGVILMTYGSATVPENVAPFLNHIYKGAAPEERIREFENRYRLIGHSPLVKITKQQAALLEEKLGSGYVIHAGMRHSDPFIEDAIKACRDAGVSKILGIILSPQQGSFIVDGYQTAFIDGAIQSGFSRDDVCIAGEWSTEKHFIELTSRRIGAALVDLQNRHGTNIPVVFTTHSLPKRVVENDSKYLAQLKATAQAVIKALDDRSLLWYAGYQSAGHTPGEWMKPDLADILTELADKHAPAVLIVPIQFLSDHLEILYDLDIAVKEQCQNYRIEYNRITMPNTDPLFISALESIVLSSTGINNDTGSTVSD